MNNATPTKNTSLPAAILFAGLIAGTIDISLALINFFIRTHKDPTLVLYYISSSFFGKAAYTGGWPMAVLGLIMHYCIALSFTIFFFWAYPKIKLLRGNLFLVAVLYGLFVWLVMNYALVPLTKIGKFPSTANITEFIKQPVILMIAIGLPVRFLAKKYYNKL